MIKKKENTDLVKIDPKKVLIENTNIQLFKKIKTIESAISDKSNSLAEIKKTSGEVVLYSIIKVWLVNLNDFLNLSRKMNSIQIDETAQMLYDEFHYLKIADISLVMKRIKTGYYGQFYESIDGMKILDIFFKYCQERMNYFISQEEIKHNELKGESWRK